MCADISCAALAGMQAFFFVCASGLCLCCACDSRDGWDEGEDEGGEGRQWGEGQGLTSLCCFFFL